MPSVGIFLSSEERSAPELVDLAARAERAGFGRAWISDHFHPWTEAQGQSPFVWSVLGGIAQATSELVVTTAVTCPTVRIHPAIVAQASATTATLMPGRFGLGVGSGEALNEHILGDRWPDADTRLAMLEEAVHVIRRLWTGEWVDHDGEHYHVEHARLYSRPEAPPPIHVSAFGPKAAAVAARIGDGFAAVGSEGEVLARFRELGGQGTAQTGMKCCWGPDEAEARRTAHRIWPNEALPGELPQVLPAPQHFEQVSALVSEDMVAEAVPCGPDPDVHAAPIRAAFEAGFDEVYVQQIGTDQQGMLDFYAREVVPRVT
jgi:G6PDH family F420-dependent oxidoreductase